MDSFNPDNELSLPDDYIVIDIETNGFSPEHHQVLEFAAVRYRDGKEVESISQLLGDALYIRQEASDVHGIYIDDIKAKTSFKDLLRYLDDCFIKKDDTFLGHNLAFDMRFINHNMKKYFNKEFKNRQIDSCRLAKKAVSDSANKKLTTLADFFNIEYKNAHRAVDDCRTTHLVYQEIKKILLNENVSNINESISIKISPDIDLDSLKKKINALSFLDVLMAFEDIDKSDNRGSYIKLTTKSGYSYHLYSDKNMIYLDSADKGYKSILYYFTKIKKISTLREICSNIDDKMSIKLLTI